MIYRVARSVMWVFMHILYRIKVTGADNIPQKDGFILCANHLHFYDPVVMAVCTKRPMCFMAKKELFKNRLIGGFLGSLGAFPVDRGVTDMQSYKKALGLLKAGKGLLIFSQGTRMKEVDVNSAKGGTALFALKSGKAVIPAGISGSYKLFSTIYVRFGEAVNMEPYHGKKLKTELIDEIMTEVMEKVQNLTKSANGVNV